MDHIFAVDEGYRFDCLSSKSTSGIESYGVFCQIRLQVSIGLVLQVDKVIVIVDAPRDAFMFA